uniref:Uncharacterized protein n=1 Tax=Periophthalmus magnuspinnatus TaxID=409849 RepID=A0A3B4ANW9_9GOBI
RAQCVMTGQRNPLERAGCASRLFLCWLSPLLHLGTKQRLEESDMYSVVQEDQSDTLGKELQSFWEREVRKSKKDLCEPSLTRVLFQCYGAVYCPGAMCTDGHPCAQTWCLLWTNCD